MSDAPSQPVRPPRSRTPVWLAALVLLVLVLLSPFYLDRMEGVVERLQYANTRGRQRALADDAHKRLASLEGASEAFRLVAHSVEPSVVHIDTLRTTSLALAGQHPAAGAADAGPEAADAGPENRSTGPLLDQQQPLHTAGQGSGLIVDEAGYILTNFHVIQDASLVFVRLSDGRTLREVEVVGVDPATDLALLKVEGKGLAAAHWGESQALEVGDWVLAVGNPFGLDRSVTAGIVSAKRRRQVVENMTYQDFLQTDASVNPGSSGGPLVNMHGEVVGINTAIVGQAYQGISFAIPSDIARDVFQRLKAGGSVVRGWLGIAMADEEVSATGERTPRAGALVQSVFPGTPAERAGIQARDVIVEWNSQPVADHTDLGLLVARTDIDTVAHVVLLRGDQKLTLDVTVGRRPEPLPE